MRQYTLMFMEHPLGAARLSRVDGPDGIASFAAVDDEAALVYVAAHLLERLKRCVRAELSSMQIVADAASASGIRLIDDSHSNPYAQESYLKYDAAANTVEVDWESTRTALLLDVPTLGAMNPR